MSKLLSRAHVMLPVLFSWSALVLVTPVCGPVARAEQNQEQIVRAALDSAATSLELGRAHEALVALQPAGELEPENPWLLFYKGVAHLRLGNAYEAMEGFDRARDLLAKFGEPEPQLAKRIEQYRREARRQVFKITYQTGLAFDTNVSFLGDAAAAGLALISGREDGKFASGLQIHYAPLATEQHALTVGARLGHTWHFSVEQFDYQDYGGYLRYARQLNDHWQADLQYDYDMTYLGNEPFLSLHALTPGLTYQWRSKSAILRPDTTRVYYRFEARDFLFDTAPSFDRDGVLNSVGVEQRFTLHPIMDWNWDWDLNLGYRFADIDTEGTEFERLTHHFYLGLEVPLVNPQAPDKYLIIPDKELMFRFNAQWELGDYRERSLMDIDFDDRSDLITTLGFSLSQKLIEDIDCGDLTLHALITWTDANSNIASVYDRRFPYPKYKPFTYDQVIYGVQLEWSW